MAQNVLHIGMVAVSCKYARRTVQKSGPPVYSMTRGGTGRVIAVQNHLLIIRGWGVPGTLAHKSESAPPRTTSGA